MRYLGVLVSLLVMVAVMAQAPPEPLEAAYQLYQRGNVREAFVAYLAIPGAECLAVAIGRSKPVEYLALLEQQGDTTPLPRRKLIEGDLLLAQGKKAEALACYRAVVAAIATNPTDGWAQGKMPAEYYPVEPGRTAQGEYRFQQAALPFTQGPGSHRDNWLIRRFIALEAWPEAEKEFARIWAIHQRYTHPFPMTTAVYDPEKQTTEEKVITVTPAGFNGRGLQCAIDYAYFLKRQQQQAQAAKVLLAPVLLMDMDRNPDNLPTPFAVPRWASMGGDSAGMSRKEYLRLAYGELKSLGQEAALVAALQAQIDQGANRARRVLARVRLHQNDIDGALAVELAYLDKADFDPLTTAYRRGLVYESAQKTAEAVAAYEKALELPYTTPRLPEEDEEATQARMMSQVAWQQPGPNSPQERTRFQTDLITRLQRLYGAQGKLEQMLALSLRQFDLNETLLENLAIVQEAASRFTANNQEARFTTWAKARAAAVKSPQAKAHLYWVLKDYQAAIPAVVESLRGSTAGYATEEWKERFRAVGQPQYRALLVALVAANPQDGRSRLELLSLDDRLDGAEATAMLELLLDGDASWAFTRGKGVYNRTRFRNYYDLAYRLMRLYEKNGQEQQLVALGFRMLEGQKPFIEWSTVPLPTPRVGWNGLDNKETMLQNLLQAAYVMLPHVKSAEDRERLRKLAEKTDCIPLKNQVAKLVDPAKATRLDPATLHSHPYPRVTVRTLGLPNGVRLLSNRDDVRAVSPDGRWIGTSWGMVRYRTNAEGALEVLQVPLGARVTTFLPTPAGLFVGTRAGLFRLDHAEGDAPTLTRIALPDRPDRGRDTKAPAWACRLRWWKEALWISESDHPNYGGMIWRYDPAKHTVQRYDNAEGPLVVGAGRLWAVRAVFDEEKGEFIPIAVDAREWRIIGATSREVWADVNTTDELRHRPALIDPKTLAVRVLPIANSRPGEKLMVNGLFEVITEDQEHVWLLGNNHALTVYARKSGELRLVASMYDSDRLPQQGPAVWHSQEGGVVYRFYCGSGTRKFIPGLELDGDRGPYFTWQTMADGRLLLGSGIVREWQEDNLGFDDNGGMSHHIQDLEGGLFAIDSRTLQWEKLGAPAAELSDFYVKRIVFDDAAKRAYVCTNGGVTILSLPDGRPVGRITVSDGLPSNKVEDVARIGDTLYLACELGDDGGGLAVLNVKTGLLQFLTMADGLEMNKIKRLRAEGTKLHILYGTAYQRFSREKGRRWVPARERDERVMTCPSSILETTTGVFTDGTELLPAATAPDPAKVLPYLGGSVLVDETHHGIRYLGGTHGLLLLEGEVTSEAGIPLATQPVTTVLSTRQLWLADVERRRPMISSREELARVLEDNNPYFRAEGLARFANNAGRIDEYFDLIAGQLTHDEVRLRATALYLIAQSRDDGKVIPALRGRLADPDPQLRAFAALALARHGVLPELARLKEIAGHWRQFGNMPFGATSSVGVQVDSERFFEALAPLATPEIVALMLDGQPHPLRSGAPWPAIYTALGAAVRQHPAMAQVLLTAYDERDHEYRTVFAQEVFAAAGKEALPVLHQALTSPDRVVRSNAARACGAIGDPASIPLLIKAMDLESGLARASIVWALGELKAAAALPALAKLYVEVSNDEKRRRGAGFRMAQVQAAMGAQYDSISNIETIGAEWTELRAVTVPPPLDPREREDLLSTRHILDAVRKIGTGAAQEFYRTLAGDKDTEARAEAAIVLAEGGPADTPKNLPILRNLLGEAQPGVRIRAAVSLYLLGQQDVKAIILEELTSSNEWQRMEMVRQLQRVQDGARLTFARAAVEAIVKERPEEDYWRQEARELLERIPAGK